MLGPWRRKWTNWRWGGVNSRRWFYWQHLTCTHHLQGRSSSLFYAALRGCADSTRLLVRAGAIVGGICCMLCVYAMRNESCPFSLSVLLKRISSCPFFPYPLPSTPMSSARYSGRQWARTNTVSLRTKRPVFFIWETLPRCCLKNVGYSWWYSACSPVKMWCVDWKDHPFYCIWKGHQFVLALPLPAVIITLQAPMNAPVKSLPSLPTAVISPSRPLLRFLWKCLNYRSLLWAGRARGINCIY